VGAAVSWTEDAIFNSRKEWEAGLEYKIQARNATAVKVARNDVITQATEMVRMIKGDHVEADQGLGT
jgi:hypothetical protein